MTKKLIITADDFGLCSNVNRAVIQAHREGVLTCASLMVTGEAFAEAVGMAKENPTLAVGLHLVLVEGKSALPPHAEFGDRLFEAGVKYFFTPGIRKQLRRECEAQIEKFLATGLTLDHINAHNHFHLHPTIGKIVAELGKKYQIPAVRLPHSPLFCLLIWILKKHLRMNGLLYNDAIAGLNESGCFTEEKWLEALDLLKEGVTEFYTHPAVSKSPILNRTMDDYHHEEELAALLSPRVRKKIKELQIETTSYQFLS